MRGTHRDVHLTNHPESATFPPRSGRSLTVTMPWDLQLRLMCLHISPMMMPVKRNMPRLLFMAVRILGEEWQLRCRQVGMLGFVVMVADSRGCRVQRIRSTMPDEAAMGAINILVMSNRYTAHSAIYIVPTSVHMLASL